MQETQAQLDVLDDKAFQSGFFDMLDLLSSTINRISCEVCPLTYHYLYYYYGRKKNC